MIDLLTFIDGGKVGGVTLPPLRLPGREPIRLSETQRRILAEATVLGDDGFPRCRTVALCWPKGGGKSLLAAAELARCFVTVPDSRSIILGPSERQVSSVVAHTLRDLLRGTYPGFEVGRQVIENPALGSTVVIVPASEASVQGVRPHKGRVVIDEAHEFPADPQARADSEVGGALNLLLSQAENPSSQVWLLGMLGSKDGYLHGLRDLAADGAVPHCYFSYETDPRALNPTMTEAFLAQRRAEMLPALYAVHFCNAAAETASGVFDGELLEAAKARGRELRLSNPVTPEQWARLRERWGWSWTVGCGLDRAMALRAGSDRTALVYIGRPDQGFPIGGSPVVVLAVEVFPQGHSASDILAAAERYTKRYRRPWATTCDAYQTLDLQDALRRINGPNVVLLHETTKVQTVAFQGLSRHLQEKRLILGEGGPTDYLVRELANLRAKLSASLDAARFEGRPHDDSAHAAALACYSLAGRNEYGTALTEEEVDERETVADKLDRGEVHDVEPAMDRLARRLARKSARAMHRIGL